MASSESKRVKLTMIDPISEQICTKPNCNCAEIESQKQGGKEIMSYPCLKTSSGRDERMKKDIVAWEEASKNNQITTLDVKKKAVLIASTENSAEQDQYYKIRYNAQSQGGSFEQVANHYDCFIYENKTHYIVIDCGIAELYRKYIKEPLALLLCKLRFGMEAEDIKEAMFDGMTLSFIPTKPVERIIFTGTINLNDNENNKENNALQKG